MLRQSRPKIQPLRWGWENNEQWCAPGYAWSGPFMTGLEFGKSCSWLFCCVNYVVLCVLVKSSWWLTWDVFGQATMVYTSWDPCQQGFLILPFQTSLPFDFLYLVLKILHLISVCCKSFISISCLLDSDIYPYDISYFFFILIFFKVWPVLFWEILPCTSATCEQIQPFACCWLLSLDSTLFSQNLNILLGDLVLVPLVWQ
jgi:hypothetical protein